MHALFGVDGCRTSGFDRFPVGYDHKYLAVAGVVGEWQVLEVRLKEITTFRFIVISMATQLLTPTQIQTNFSFSIGDDGFF